LLALVIGINQLERQTQHDSWLANLLRRTLEIERDSRRADFLYLATALLEGTDEQWVRVSPVLQAAVAAKGFVTPSHEVQQAAYRTIMVPDAVDHEWVAFHAAALQTLFAMEAAIDLVHHTVEQVVALLKRIPAALKRWPWEHKPKTLHKEVTAQRWDIQHEYHVQSLLWTVLRPVFPNLEDEENLPSLGHKHPRADLLVPGLRLVIEVKYLREATQSSRAKIIEEVAADTALYLNEHSEYDQLIAFIWDATGSIHHHDELIAGLCKLPSVTNAVIVSRPGEWKRK
jgi:hypothetical protein